MTKTTQQKKIQFSWLRACLCASLLMAGASLLTPYPADIIRAIRGKASNTSPTQTPEQTRQTAVSSPPPSQSEHMVDSRTLTPWQWGDLQTPPTVEYPPFPPVIQPKISTGKFYSVTELARGFSINTVVNFTQGGLATLERKDLKRYNMTISINAPIPKPMSTQEELEQVNPELGKILPGLKDMFPGSKVSPFFTKIIQLKQNHLRKNASQLNRILDRHNFYDLATILEFSHPSSKRKVLWIQSDMDVVSDGSDGDRLKTMPDKILNSSFYQPSTSYRWPKRSSQPNPLLTVWEKKLKTAQESATKATGSKKQGFLDDAQHARLVIAELKTSSFLIAEYDPFIVIPLSVVNEPSDFSPRFGDYAVVIVSGKIYPAIVGDAGPRYKTGEASLRLAQTINSRANSNARPVSDLTVSYVIFPGTANPDKGPPNYDEWKINCDNLIKEIGGLGEGYTLHEWTDLLAPKQITTPTDTKDDTDAS